MTAAMTMTAIPDMISTYDLLGLTTVISQYDCSYDLCHESRYCYT